MGLISSIVNTVGERTLKGAAWGAGAGALYGAMSGNTSMIGGAMTGALLGAGVARYGVAGARAGARSGKGILSPLGAAKAYGEAFAGGVYRQASRDLGAFRRLGNHTAMGTNKGFSRISSLFR